MPEWAGAGTPTACWNPPAMKDNTDTKKKVPTPNIEFDARDRLEGKYDDTTVYQAVGR